MTQSTLSTVVLAGAAGEDGSLKSVSPKRNPEYAWLRSHETSEMAARAHDVAALAIKGKSAHLNFPGSAHELPIPASNSCKDIQAAAALAAARAKEIDQPSRAESLDAADDPFLDLPDLFLSDDHQIDSQCYIFPIDEIYS